LQTKAFAAFVDATQNNVHITSRDRAIKAARKMPVLDHYQPGRPFNISESDVVAWLCAQPEIQQQIFNWLKYEGALLYLDGQWIGSDTYAEEQESSTPVDEAVNLATD
jgi:hypothetical protein